jgi:hypothetical protein
MMAKTTTGGFNVIPAILSRFKPAAAHCSEDELTLFYYGEGRRRPAIERHLEGCAACAALYREITATLDLIAAPEAPPRGEQYGLEVWQRIRHRLPEREGPLSTAWMRLDRLALAGAAAVLVLAAFVAGRIWPRDSAPTPAATPTVESRAASDVERRILLTSVADHLDTSERVLTDVMNASDASDISAAQRWAEDLLETSRLYRQDAADAGEASIASVLDELERSLLEIVHSPAKISAADLEQIRGRIDAAALLFKVRVMSDELRQRGEAPAARPTPRLPTRKIS